MKNILSLLLAVLISFATFGQGVQTTNAFLNVSSGTYFTILKGTNVNFKQNGSSHTINNGNIIVDGGFTNAGTATIDNDGVIKVTCNWTNTAANNVFINRDTNGLTILNGSTTQVVSGNSTRFENLTIDNSSGGKAINLTSDQIVEHITTLTDGVVATGTNYIILESATGTHLAAYSDSSFVFGNLRRYIGSNTHTYSLPLGDSTSSTDYQLAEIVNGNLNGGGFSYIDTKFSSLLSGGTIGATEEGVPYSNVCSDGVWHITPNVEPTTGDYDLKLYFTNFSCGLSNNDFAILSRPDTSSNAADWVCTPCGFGDPGINTNNGIGRKVSDGFALRLGINDFSQKGIGFTGGFPIPVQLLNLEAKLNHNSKVDLNWSTASEINNNYFTIERSSDGETWIVLLERNGSGNSSTTVHYHAIDNNPLSGISYYRLKQTDFDNESTYSKIILINNQTIYTAAVNIYPNPALDYLTIEKQIGDLETVKISNLFGQVVNTPEISRTTSRIILNIRDIPAGMYFVKTDTTVNIIHKK